MFLTSLINSTILMYALLPCRCLLMSVQHAKLVTSKTGSIPLKLPKALVLSQFKVDTLPIVVPVDVLVDGQPAGMFPMAVFAKSRKQPVHVINR